jgi:DNA-binding NarL/FixJ family response regulator
VQAARKLGAWGYVKKINAANDLLPALQAVMEGKQFFGSS